VVAVVSADTKKTNDPEGPLASDNPTSGEGSEFRRQEEAYRVSADTEALLAAVRQGLNPRGHHRLCRVNMPTDFSSECNCPYEENEREHAALDSLADRIEELERALSYYAERRNYRPPAGNTTHDIPLGGWMERNDSYDGDGAGARAREALS